ncbi:MAG: OmpA family protein [Cyclobacteriaceae bacterium]|nr:OmpA family protein [Cyclobacteriaceae bacterium]
MKTLLLGLCFVSYLTSFSQADNFFVQSENFVVVEGRVLNAETREPITARIVYQSLPFGNRTGVINSSSFSFSLFDNERYSIEVNAVGYASAKYMIDPAEANGQNKIIKDIELQHSTGNTSQKLEAGKVLRLDNLIFEVAKSKIDPDSYAELDLVVRMMDENKGMVIQLEGHTDYLGDPGKNMKLSEQRVEAVKDYLVARGIHKSRVKLKAFGGTVPLSRDDTPEGHRLNRRVELRILKN